MKPFLEKLDKGDAAIWCAARLAKVSAFVTWNTRDFMKHGVDVLVDVPIVVPAGALKLFRKAMATWGHTINDATNGEENL